jgi:hypothetical protein
MLVTVLALFGLVALIVGVFAWRYVRHLSQSSILPARWKHFRMAAIVLGLFLAIGLSFIGYSYSSSEGVGWVVGMPFMVAFFENAGRDYAFRDYIGPSLPAIIGNFMAWFLLPQIVLAFYGWRVSNGNLPSGQSSGLYLVYWSLAGLFGPLLGIAFAKIQSTYPDLLPPDSLFVLIVSLIVFLALWPAFLLMLFGDIDVFMYPGLVITLMAINVPVFLGLGFLIREFVLSGEKKTMLDSNNKSLRR